MVQHGGVQEVRTQSGAQAPPPHHLFGGGAVVFGGGAVVFVVAVTAGVRPFFFVPEGWETLLVTLLWEGSLDDCDPIAGLDGLVRGT